MDIMKKKLQNQCFTWLYVAEWEFWAVKMHMNGNGHTEMILQNKIQPEKYWM